MKKIELNLTPYISKIKNRILINSGVEEYILRNFSTKKDIMAKVYKESLKISLQSILGKSDEDGIELFKYIKETDYNHRYMELLVWIESLIVKEVGPIYNVVYTSDVKRTDDEYILYLEVK